jgi:hypothetical protein
MATLTGGVASTAGSQELRNKTVRRLPNDEASLNKVLDDSIKDAYKRPWHRLERGLRLNRIRMFVEEEKKKTALTQFESASLLALLQKALDKKLLNSKTTVIYDQDKEAILEIKGLVMHRAADGIMKYQILEKKAASTLRKKKDDGVVGATGTAADTVA